MAKVVPIPDLPEHGSEKHRHHHKLDDDNTDDDDGFAALVHKAVKNWRGFLHRSGFYDSAASVFVRRFLRGKFFAIVAMFCLFIALFCADLFVIFGSEKNTLLNIILTFVFAVFFFEFVGLALTDPSYLFSFFFWMDLVGTASMIFDISYLLGPDATKNEKISGQNAEDNVIVVRAARAAKLGARAGRLSRVMKLLRFLPFVASDTHESDGKMARVISSQLTNVLSTRVAFLTICIVVVLPIFSIFSYPETDDSLSAWTEMLSEDSNLLYELQNAVPANPASIAAQQARLDRELNAFASFYSSVSYGPFAVCFDPEGNDDFDCTDLTLLKQFNSSFTRPGRNAFIGDVTKRNFLSMFDLSTPRKIESVANASLIVFIIVVMCVFGLLTSSSITVIALHPLERMLKAVRDKCKQIFHYMDDIQEEDSEDEEDYDDADHASEFALLEKVVSKLAVIVRLTNTKDAEFVDGMTEEEQIALNWMQGGQTVAKRRPSVAPPVEHEHVSHAINTSTFGGIPYSMMMALDTDGFNTLDVGKEESYPLVAHIISNNDGSTKWVQDHVQPAQLFKFISSCESRYLPNQFHNFAHAMDVLYVVARNLRITNAHKWLPETSQFWLMIAAIAHDLGHTGVNNQFLTETSHELALKYNDRSPMENMHCATLFQLVADPQANVFSQIERDLYKEMRQGIINAILHTDVTKHNEMMKELVMMYQMNSESFDSCLVEPTEEVVAVLSSSMQLSINALLHAADVNNPFKPWDLAQKNAYLCVGEFFAQGDQEKAAGIPVGFLNDRDKVNVPFAQIGFVEFVIAPMVESMIRIFPPTCETAVHQSMNIQNWFELWKEETNAEANPESLAKNEARIRKVVSKLEQVIPSFGTSVGVGDFAQPGPT